jgi:hypothetical protein
MSFLAEAHVGFENRAAGAFMVEGRIRTDNGD